MKYSMTRWIFVLIIIGLFLNSCKVKEIAVKDNSTENNQDLYTDSEVGKPFFSQDESKLNNINASAEKMAELECDLIPLRREYELAVEPTRKEEIGQQIEIFEDKKARIENDVKEKYTNPDEIESFYIHYKTLIKECS